MSRQSPEEHEYTHFAMIYIDRDGNLCQRASESISESRQTILSPRVTGEFLRAVAMSRETHTHSQVSPEVQVPSSGAQSPESVAYSGMSLGSQQRMPVLGQSESPFRPTMWPSSESWPLQPSAQPKKKNFGGRSLNLASQQKTTISVKERGLLRLYYEKIFQNLQQTNCRIIAKAYIKLVEPRKQVNYPYNGRKIVEGRTQQLDPEATKPPWWPRGVSHREPDHLPKVERIRLLVYILCEMRKTYGITAARLKQCDQPIRRQILPVERLHILDEAYRVREEEERFLDGLSDGNHVCIARTNLPQIAEDTSSGQSSPTEPTPSHNTVESECSDGISGIDITQVTSGDLPSAPSYNPSHPYNPAMHLGPNMQYQSIGPATTMSTPPLELRPKHEPLSAGTHLIDRTRPVSLAHYPYPGVSGIQPTPMEFYGTPDLSQDAGVPITQPSTGNLPTEPMMPYGHPYYFNY
ncbi:hypothetical protein N7517_006502 [Penicillium concentricum]|uniref:Subtelomeric hrmA-associated cluster protein AFUB-079030/YDR124W-like helical bundle domain-containing protein n=1 Tax=Penicillium concentricum TaxID=293559 RepID=A0A9W9S9D2_9EURO|nr:uncharacterized protein N7517_006502 [Penicillium concentricum]KAJ5374496.1 hypothetical protein N7517_006502 [Penicillium concentricum]